MVVNNSKVQLSQSPREFQSQVDVAIFLRNLYGGGTEKVMLDLADSFIERGLKVDLVLVRAEGHYLDRVSPQIRVIDLDASSKLAIVPKLTDYLRRVQPIALLTGLHYPSEMAILAKRLAGVSTRIIVSEHNTLSQEAKRIPQRSVRLSPWAARLFYPWADGIVAVSQGVADDLARITGLSGDRIRTIYNPVISPELATLARSPVAHPWFQAGEPPAILGVGRLSAQKDFPTLIRAFAAVRQVRPARLMILGDGPDRQSLLDLASELGISEDVALPGFVQNPYAYMAKSAVFVLSSAWEGLGNVLVEAMAVGTPVVSTNCESGPMEILDRGRYGALVPVGDDAAIARSILAALAGDIKTVDAGWLDRFTLDVCVRQYLDVLHL